MRTNISKVSAAGSVSIDVLFNEGRFCFEAPYYFDPEFRWQQDLQIAEWCEEKYTPYPIYNAEAHLVRVKYQPRPFRQVGGLQPNLILAAALGAELIMPGTSDPDINRAPLSGINNFSDLRSIRLVEQTPINTFLSQIDELKVCYTGQMVDIFPPFFWDCSGRAVIHGPLTTAVKLIGEEFFTLVFSDFYQAQQLISWITDAYLDLIRLFAGKVGLGFNDIHIGECTGSLFSADVWERLALPAMNKLAEAAGSVRIHSCGHSDHLITQMLKVKHLNCLNIGSNTSIRKVRKLFGKNLIIDVIPDFSLLQAGSSEEIENWVRKSIEENDQGPLEIQFHLDAGVPYENIKTIFTVLEAQGIQTNCESLCRRWKIPNIFEIIL